MHSVMANHTENFPNDTKGKTFSELISEFTGSYTKLHCISADKRDYINRLKPQGHQILPILLPKPLNPRVKMTLQTCTPSSVKN